MTAVLVTIAAIWLVLSVPAALVLGRMIAAAPEPERCPDFIPAEWVTTP